MPPLSSSQVASWTRCRYAWRVAWVEKIAPKRPSRVINIGSAVHQSLAGFLLSHHTTRDTDSSLVAAETALRRWFESNIPVVEDDPEMETNEFPSFDEIFGIVTRTVSFLEPERWQTIELGGHPLIEHKVQVPMPFWEDGFQAWADWVARDDETGLVWVVDFKTRSAFTTDEDEDTNLQLALYQAALREAGVVTAGSRLLQIRNRIPQQPHQNKDGQMSRREIPTTWPVYRDALLAVGQNPDHYQDVKDMLLFKEAGGYWHRWTFAFRGDTELDSLWEDTKIIAEEIARATQDQRHQPRELGFFSCKTCMVRSLCFARLRHHDAEWLQETEYEQRETVHEDDREDAGTEIPAV